MSKCSYHGAYISLIAQWVHHEGSIRRPIAPWVNALTTELHLRSWLLRNVSLIQNVSSFFFFFFFLFFFFFFSYLSQHLQKPLWFLPLPSPSSEPEGTSAEMGTSIVRSTGWYCGAISVVKVVENCSYGWTCWPLTSVVMVVAWRATFSSCMSVIMRLSLVSVWVTVRVLGE